MIIVIIAAVLVTGATVHWNLHGVDWLNLGFMIVGLVGVFGYAYKRRLVSKSFWVAFAITALMYQIAYSFVLDQKYGASPATSTSEGLVTFVPLIPMFIALYFYIYNSKLLD